MLSRLVTWLPFSMKQSSRLIPALRKWLAMGAVVAAAITTTGGVMVLAVVDEATTLLPPTLLPLVATDAGEAIGIR